MFDLGGRNVGKPQGQVQFFTRHLDAGTFIAANALLAGKHHIGSSELPGRAG